MLFFSDVVFIVFIPSIFSSFSCKDQSLTVSEFPYSFFTTLNVGIYKFKKFRFLSSVAITILVV